MYKYYVQSSKQYEKVSSFFDRKAKCHFVSNSMKIDTRAKKKVSIQYLQSGLSEIFAKIMLPLFGKSKCHTNREGQSLVGQVNKFSNFSCMFLNPNIFFQFEF